MTETAAIDEQEIPLPKRRSNRPVTMLHRIEYGLALLLIALFRLIGVDASSAIAGGFMRFVGPKLRSVSKRSESNMARIFSDWPEDKIKSATKDVWENLGRTAAEFAHLEKFRPFEEGGRVAVGGADRLSLLVEKHQAAIFVSGHFANWEVMSIALQRAGVDYAVVYRAANNPLVDQLIINKRAQVMSRRQIPKGKRGGKALIETLKSGRSLAMLVDQKLNDGISVPFMGREAMTAPAAARLALKFNLPVMPISIERLKGAHFKVSFREAIRFEPSGDTAADVLAFTAEINQAIENDIRARPGQWLWLHRRWPKQE